MENRLIFRRPRHEPAGCSECLRRSAAARLGTGYAAGGKFFPEAVLQIR